MKHCTVFAELLKKVYVNVCRAKRSPTGEWINSSQRPRCLRTKTRNRKRKKNMKKKKKRRRRRRSNA